MVEVMAGSHPRDPLSFDVDLDFRGALQRDVDGFEIAYTPEYGIFPIDSRVRSVIDDAVEAFERAGATVTRVEPDIEHTHHELTDIWLRQIGMLYQSMSIGFEDQGIDLLANHRDELSPAFAELLEDTHDMSVRRYKRDEHVRTEVYDAIQDVLDEYDLLLGPSLAVPPVENATDESTKGPTAVEGEPIDPLIGWCCTYLTNFTGHPAASIPAGLTDSGLPIGMEIIGDRLSDDAVLTASAVFERVRPWHDTYPGR
jgi:amidase/aspartyl-tRNA(Asn)/glutamyl-tRNA(Gln) amidotransferase subunit A